eukprot:TRINITY_DN6597_c0_g1_i5.p1 TRINITY_DN6597_c0_g1~~TRINITY_DN6597_c0_g1_i5.p1  ORF type:complete len:918 (+),score=176.67 TRINITY_DN6597_c0_g1_i5:87-2840(+)
MGSVANSVNDMEMFLGWKSATTISFTFRGDNLDYDIVDSDEWHHWSFVFDHVSRTQSIFRDGVKLATRIANGMYLGSSAECQLGARESSGMKLYLDEFRIWNRALTDQQISDQFTARDLYSPARYTQGLAVVYNFDDPTNLGLDSSGNGLNGQVVGKVQQQTSIITQACAAGCVACATPRYCATCSSNYTLVSGLCVTSCPTGYLQFYQQCVTTCPAHTVPTGSSCADLYRDGVLALAPNAYYPMQETNPWSFSFADISASSGPNPLLIPGYAPTLGSSGPFFSSLVSASFTASLLTRAEIPNLQRLMPSSPFSVSVWVNVRAKGGYQSIMTCRYPGWILYVDPNGKYAPWFNNGAYSSTSLTPVRFGEWEHVVMVLSAGSVYLYVAGSLTATATIANYAANSAYICAIGRGNTETDPGQYYLDGSIADLAIFPSALSASQIQNLFVARACPHFSAPYTIVNGTCQARANATRAISPSSNYTTGDTLTLAVDFTELVYVPSNTTTTTTATMPQLLLSLTSTVPAFSRVGIANYVSGSGSRSLTFQYVVSLGDTTWGNVGNVLDIVNQSALVGSVTDRYGRAVNVTLPFGMTTTTAFASQTSLRVISVPDSTSQISCNITRIVVGSTALCTITPQSKGVNIPVFFSAFSLILSQGTLSQLPSPSSYLASFSFLYTAPSSPPTLCDPVFLHDSISAQAFNLVLLDSATSDLSGTTVFRSLLLGSTITFTVLHRNASTQYPNMVDPSRVVWSDGGANGVFKVLSSQIATTSRVSWTTQFGVTQSGLVNLTVAQVKDGTNILTPARVALSVVVFAVPDPSTSISCPSYIVTGSVFNCTVSIRKNQVSVATYRWYVSPVAMGTGQVLAWSSRTGYNFGSVFDVSVLASAPGVMQVWDGISAQPSTVNVLSVSVGGAGVGCGQ